MTAMFHASSEVATLAGATQMVCVIPSHRDLVYVAQSPLDDQIHLSEVRLVQSDAVPSMISPGTLCIGPGAEQVVSRPISGLTRLSARFVAYAAWRLIDAGYAASDPMTFAPEYHQDFLPR